MSGTFNYGLGSMVPKIISFFLIPVYTSFLSPTDYGIVEICGSLFQVIYTVMRLGMPGSVSRFYFDHKDNPEELRDYVRTIYEFLVGASIIIGVILGVIFYFFANVLTPELLFFPFIVIVIINSAFSANSSLQLRLLQSTENSRYSALLNIANAFIGIVAAIVFVVVFKLGAKGILYSQLLTTIIFFVQAQVYLKKYLKGKFNYSMLKTSFSYGMSTLPHHLFIVFTPLLSKLILVHTSSLAALGVFSLASKFVQPLQLLYSAFNQSYSPIYFSLRKEGTSEQRIGYYSRLIWITCCIFFMGFLFIIPPLIPLITNARFHASAPLVPILASSFIWQIIYFLSVVELFYNKKNKFVSLISMTVMITNILVTVLLVSKYGSIALAWAQCIGLFAMALIATYFSNKYGEVKLLKGLIWQTFLVNLICLGIDKFLISSDMLVLRIFLFMLFSAFLFYFFIWKNKDVLNLILSLKIFNRKKPSTEG